MLHGAPLIRHLQRSCLRTPRSPPPPQLIPRRHLLTLAIETSCDDTCVAILDHDRRRQCDMSEERTLSNPVKGAPGDSSTRLLFNDKITAKNTGKGGIHPLEALDSHRANLANLVNQALLSLPTTDLESIGEGDAKVFQCRDGRLRRRPDFVSVTRGPGMRSNLSCGLETAKGLAVAWQVPLVGVHHMQAHALTPRLIHALESTHGPQSDYRPEFPFLTLLVSGGHTMLLHSTGLTEHKILASTNDVAIGDALDKCGRLLLPEQIKSTARDTAFAKYLSQYAFPDRSSFASWPVPTARRDEIDKPPNKFGWQVQVPLSDTRDLRFSFSSIYTQIERICEERRQTLGGQISAREHLLLAQTGLGTAFEHLASRTVIALEQLKGSGLEICSLVVSGGVAANDFLRFYLKAMLATRGFDHVNLIFPPVNYCTDNAAMIAWAGMEMYESGYASDLEIDAIRKWSMDAESADGGILGVKGWRLVDQSL